MIRVFEETDLSDSTYLYKSFIIVVELSLMSKIQRSEDFEIFERFLRIDRIRV